MTPVRRKASTSGASTKHCAEGSTKETPSTSASKRARGSPPGEHNFREGDLVQLKASAKVLCQVVAAVSNKVVVFVVGAAKENLALYDPEALCATGEKASAPQDVNLYARALIHLLHDAAHTNTVDLAEVLKPIGNLSLARFDPNCKLKKEASKWQDQLLGTSGPLVDLKAIKRCVSDFLKDQYSGDDEQEESEVMSYEHSGDDAPPFQPLNLDSFHPENRTLHKDH